MEVEELRGQLESKDAEIDEQKEKIESLTNKMSKIMQQQIASLPAEEGELISLRQKVEQFTEVLQKLHAKSLIDSEKISGIVKLEDELVSTKAQIKVLKDQNNLLGEQIKSLNERLDENAEFEAIQEELTEKYSQVKEELDSKNKEIAECREIIAISKDLEESNAENELDLQNEIEDLQSQLASAHRDLVIRNAKLDECNRANSKLRELREQLELDLADARAGRSNGGGESSALQTSRWTRQINLLQTQLETRNTEFCRQQVEQNLLLLSLNTARHQLSFISNHIPQNITIDSSSLNLLLLLERLQGKVRCIANNVNQMFISGTNTRVTDYSIESASAVLRDRQVACDMCSQLFSLLRHLEVISYGIWSSDANAFDTYLSAREGVSPELRQIDSRLDRIISALSSNSSITNVNCREVVRCLGFFVMFCLTRSLPGHLQLLRLC